jgi:hydrogenase expression/formation protein HypC
MCLALPSRVLQVDGLSAVVDSGGQARVVSLMLLDEPVAVGDYLLVQHGLFAFERLDAERARESLALIDEVVAGAQDADLRRW